MIYDNPWAYDLACSFRDVGPEVDVLLRWYVGRPRNVLELAAGPAEHAREFARRGIAATALDLNQKMCDYARSRAAVADVRLEVVGADMRYAALGRRFDLIITMLDSTAHLETLDDFLSYLSSAADHLAPGGLMVIEMSHPADRLTGAPRASARWRVERDGVAADVRWGEPSDALDPVTQIVDEHVTIAIEGGATITGVVRYRFWTATELAAAIRLSGRFEIAAQYGGFDGEPLGAPEAWRMITLLRAIGPERLTNR